MMTNEEMKTEIVRLSRLVLDDRSTEIERQEARARMDELRILEGTDAQS